MTIESAPFDAARFRSIEEQEGWFANLARTIAIDFDGVLHPYTAGWVGSTPADEPPTVGAGEFVASLKLKGYRLVVFSTRCDHAEGVEGTKAWLSKWGFDEFIDDVTCTKPAAVAYVDDRAVPFTGDWEAVRAGIRVLAKNRNHGAAPSATTNVLKVLNLSTSHLPEKYGSGDRITSIQGLVVYELDHGFLVWVPLDNGPLTAEQRAFPEEIGTLLQYARAIGCAYILFDSDAPVDPALPTWSW